MADVTEKTETKVPDTIGQEAGAADVKPTSAELAGKEEESKTTDAETDAKPADSSAEKPDAEKKEPAAGGDVDMKDAGEASVVEADQSTAAVETPSTKAKDRRKSVGESKAKTLNKKGSKARITHIDAKPGDHFLVKLKGFPAWPAIVCDEAMLPEALLNSRPVTAAKPDGTYADAYAEGGKRAYDRTFPVMYLYTNEFSWAHNGSFTELTPEKAQSSITEKMRKDLKAAFELAAEHNSIDHYKEMLRQIMEEFLAQQEAKREAANTPKKSKKGKGKADDEDVDMVDSDSAAKSKSKKRKADEGTSTPQRSDSVKKPKIKLNTSSTPKTANGAGTPKNDSAKASKSKPKKAKEGEKKVETPKLTPEERHARKEKEVLYLRHKLQRGLLTRDQQPQESEMKQMSEFITMLENMQELEVSIIRATKINKVLKAILKLDSIPREEDFKFKARSQTLLDKWNKLMASDSTPAQTTNGVSGEKKSETNGSKADSEQPKPEESIKEVGVEEKAEASEKTAPASTEAVEASA